MRKAFVTCGLVVVSVAFGAGCASEPSSSGGATKDPQALAKVTSSSHTQSLTKASTWRVYGGRTQIVAMGFGKDRKPVDGIRFRFNTNPKATWWVSAETLSKKGGYLLLGKPNRIVKDTMSAEDKRIFHGAIRAAFAYAQKQQNGVATQGFRAFADDSGCSVGGLAGAVAGCFGTRPACKNVLKNPKKNALGCLAAAGTCASGAPEVGACIDAAKKALGVGTDQEKSANPNKAAQNASKASPEKDATDKEDAADAEDKDATDKENGEDAEDKDAAGEESGEDAENAEDANEEAADQLDDTNGDESADAENEGTAEDEFAGESAEDEGSGEAAEDEVAENDDVDPTPEEDFTPSDEGTEEASLRTTLASGLGVKAHAKSSSLRSATLAKNASCGASRTLQCGSSARFSFCRCVAR